MCSKSITTGAMAQTLLSTAAVIQETHPRLLAPKGMKAWGTASFRPHSSHLDRNSWVASIVLTTAMVIGTWLGHRKALPSVSPSCMRSRYLLQVYAMSESSDRFAVCFGSWGKVHIWFGVWKTATTTCLAETARVVTRTMSPSVSPGTPGGSLPRVGQTIAVSTDLSRLWGTTTMTACCHRPQGPASSSVNHRWDVMFRK